MTGKCVVCGKEIPKDRGKRDTCSHICGYAKVQAWAEYIKSRKDVIMKAALDEWRDRHGRRPVEDEGA